MDIKNQTLKAFINSSSCNASNELSEAIIKQIGGEQRFLCAYDVVSKHGTACEYSGLMGDELRKFVEVNRENLLAHAKKVALLGDCYSLVEYAHEDVCLEGYDMDDVAKALYGNGKGSDALAHIKDRMDFWLGLTCFKELCCEYESYLGGITGNT